MTVIHLVTVRDHDDLINVHTNSKSLNLRFTVSPLSSMLTFTDVCPIQVLIRNNF